MAGVLSCVFSLAVAQQPGDQLDRFERLVREVLIAGRTDRAVKTQVRQCIDYYGQEAPENFWLDAEETVVSQCMDWLAVAYAPVYRNHFSEKEMKEMIRYYQTPYFQKLLDISEETAAVGVEKATEWGNYMQRKVLVELDRYLKYKDNH